MTAGTRLSHGAVGRRTVLSTAILASVSRVLLRPAVLPAAEVPQLRAFDDASSIRNWGTPWSRADRGDDLPQKDLLLPGWLEGDWQVQMKLKDVSFPLGRSFVSDTTPGVRMVSLLPVPNVGNSPRVQLRFRRSGEGAQWDRGENTKAILEGFWPAARVTDVDASAAAALKLTYTSPTRTRKDVEQHVEVRDLWQELLSGGAGEGAGGAGGDGGDGGDRVVAWSTVSTQQNVEQRVAGEYQCFYRVERRPSGQVIGQQRVAVFLLPTDERYLEAKGRPVLVVDYLWDLKRA